MLQVGEGHQTIHFPVKCMLTATYEGCESRTLTYSQLCVFICVTRHESSVNKDSAEPKHCGCQGQDDATATQNRNMHQPQNTTFGVQQFSCWQICQVFTYSVGDQVQVVRQYWIGLCILSVGPHEKHSQ